MQKQLSPEAEKLRESTLELYPDLADDDVAQAVLQTGLEALDMVTKAQRQVEDEGMVVKGDRGNTKAHPLLPVIRDQRAQFLACLKALRLDLAVVEQGQQAGPGRPTDFELYQKRHGGRA